MLGLEKVQKISGKGLESLKIYFQNCVGTLTYASVLQSSLFRLISYSEIFK